MRPAAPDELTENEKRIADQLTEQVDKAMNERNAHGMLTDELHYNMTATQHEPEDGVWRDVQVWDEVVRRALEAGYDAWRTGGMVTIRRRGGNR